MNRHSGPRLVARASGGLAMAALLAIGATASAQNLPGTRIVDTLPRYGGYLPFGGAGYPAYSGAPLGGYTPFGVQGPEAGWLKIDYGLGYDDFANSNRFGTDWEDGLQLNNNGGFSVRPPEFGRGAWNNSGAATANPPPVWPYPRRR